MENCISLRSFFRKLIFLESRKAYKESSQAVDTIRSELSSCKYGWIMLKLSVRVHHSIRAHQGRISDKKGFKKGFKKGYWKFSLL